MDTLLVILISVFVVSLISFVGIITLVLRKKEMDRALIFLVSFSAGSCFGGAFIHLLPEAIEKGGAEVVGFALVGILVFFVMEKFLFWQHCHKPGCHEHTFAYMNLVGDGMHNFIDGVVIAASYLASTQLGVASTMAIVLHEIPQEIGDFAVLIKGGFKTNKALLVNFLTALTAVLGALVTFFVLPSLKSQLAPVLSFAAGGFIYIAGSDLVPELHKEVGTKKSIGVFISLILGVILIWLLRFVE
ncbi:ZIP family metal transporter [Candidatus Micrarchaeota archaeon]|nr:ZIP family metal transporter [Candidatus Micrarchaeota archaeon]